MMAYTLTVLKQGMNIVRVLHKDRVVGDLSDRAIKPSKLIQSLDSSLGLSVNEKPSGRFRAKEGSDQSYVTHHTEEEGQMHPFLANILEV